MREEDAYARRSEGALDQARHLAENTRTLVIGPYSTGWVSPADLNPRAAESRLEEAVGLTRAIDLTVVATEIVPIRKPRPATFLGTGKIETLKGQIIADRIGLVVMDCALSPVQQRNLEKELGAKVIDRTGLILEIFGRRASTKEGSLQVELAHLAYQKSRLVRSWTHLERQRGGFGFLGGPGETQIEADRRLIQERITRLERELEGVKRTRGLHRANRDKVPFPTVALVGYTNAGKSSLFNRLTRADVLAKDMLFATLDPTTRAVDLPHGMRIILSDTVGFISDLPTQLIAAFRATLEDVTAADVVLHVRDIAAPESEAQDLDVKTILAELGFTSEDERRIVEVWNKADLLDAAERERLGEVAQRKGGAAPVLVSAVSGEGIEALLSAIEERLAAGRRLAEVTVGAEDGAGLHWLYDSGEVLQRVESESGDLVLTVRVRPERWDALFRRFPAAREAGTA